MEEGGLREEEAVMLRGEGRGGNRKRKGSEWNRKALKSFLEEKVSSFKTLFKTGK